MKILFEECCLFDKKKKKKLRKIQRTFISNYLCLDYHTLYSYCIYRITRILLSSLLSLYVRAMFRIRI